MRKDIDYVDHDSDSLIDDRDWVTPSHSKGYFKLRLTDRITVYYRFIGSRVFLNVVLSFDSLGAHAPRSLPSLFYSFVDMLDIWERIGDDTEDNSE